MEMKSIFLVAVMAAGLVAVAMPQPAQAGGHESWRSCGGMYYEGCDGIARGPYAADHRRGYGSQQFGWAPGGGRAHWADRGGYRGGGGSSYGGQSVTVERYGRRIHIQERTRSYIRVRIYHD